MRAIFQKKRQKRAKKNVEKGQNVWKFEQKCTKFENILKKGRRLRAKLLEKTLISMMYKSHYKQLDTPMEECYF